MIRKGLRLQLALCINAILGFHHALTIPNAQRYCTADTRAQYQIRKNAEITLEDWIVAIQICRVDRVGHFERISRDDSTPVYERFEKIINSLNFYSSGDPEYKVIQTRLYS